MKQTLVGVALAFAAALSSIATNAAAQTSQTEINDPYALYYAAVQSNGLFNQQAEMFRALPDAVPAASYQLASHKTGAHSSNSQTIKRATSNTDSAKASIYSGTWKAVVDKSEQRMRVYRNGSLVHSWKVSTGKRGHSTPTGSFRANSSRIYKDYTSKKYNAPMPYSVFYYHGYAVHGTYNTKALGRPASRGCVRLSNTNARKFYNIAKAQRSSLRIQVRN